jgi:hypothetical protein
MDCRILRLSLFVACATLLASSAAVFAGGLIDRFGPPIWQVGGSQPAALHGFSATTAGDVDGDGYSDVIVGAELEDSTLTDEGAAYLYRGSSQGSALTASWIYHGRQLSAYAGAAVAPAGDVNNDGYADVLVAVPGWDTPAHADVGKVVVFHGGPNGLSPTPAIELFSPTPATDKEFGISVAPAGDVNGDGYADVLVGSSLQAGGFIIGAAYLFEGGVGGLFATPAMTMLGFPGADSHMGSSLSTAGDVNADGFADFIVGSPGDSRTLTGAGAAYVFTGKATGDAELDTLLKGTSVNVNLGRSVSVAGDVNGDGYSDVIIGVPQAGTNFPGKAMIGFGGSTGLATIADLPNPEAPANEFTGLRVSTLGDINGDGLADIGVVSRNVLFTNRGRVSVYLGDRTGPQYFGEILTHGSDGFFGNCLATSGDTDGDGFSEILVGTEDVSVQPGQHEGVAYQFKAPKNGLRLAIGGWPRSGGSPGTGYGSAVALVTHFDLSEVGWLVIGDPQFGGNGRVSLHDGSQAEGVGFAEELSYPASGSFQSYGAKIVDAGDTDGDSFSDFAVSKTTIDAGPANQVGAVVLHRGGLGVPPAPITIVTGTSPFDRVGSALAGRGDVNGDGYQDLLIGAREWDEPGSADCGKVFLYFGSATGLLATPPWTHVGSVAGQGFGAGVALADYDADGYTDVIVGSSSPTFAATAPGRVDVYYGGPSGPANTPGVVYLPPTPDNVSFGLTVAAVGDVTGDGIADLGIGAPRENNRGVVRIYGGTLGRSQAPSPIAVVVGTQDNARLGEAIAGGGDVDGDGVGDMAIGEPGWDGGLTDEGRFGLIYGPIVVHDLVPAIFIESNILGAALGASIAPFRDINLDGFADVIVGAPGVAGRVYPFMGGGGFGKRLDLQPVDYGGSNQRAVHPARSHDPDQVAAFFIQNTAAQGRTRLGYEIEIKPTGQPFDGVPTSLSGSTTFESGPAGSQTPAFTISFLSPELPGRTLKLRGRWTTPNPLFPRSRWGTPEAHTSGDHDVWLTGTSVGVPAPGAAPLRIEAVAPNPAFGRGSSVVSFTLPRAGRVSLDVYDLRGARVRRTVDETHSAGRSAMAWDGKSDDGWVAAAGMYLLVLRAGDEVARAKIIRLP